MIPDPRQPICSSARTRSRRGIAAVIVVASMAVAGCAADDIELNGGIFNALGVGSGSSTRSEPKVAARAPLVVPPTVQALPQPGVAPEAQAVDVTGWINDPDRKEVVSQAELERQQQAYCREHYELAKARGDNDAEQAAGPLGPCRTSILTAIKKWNEGDDTE